MRLALTAFAALVGAVPTGATDLPPDDLAAARQLNLTKCAKCHKLYYPGDYSVPDWDVWMVKMAKKSKLKARQTLLLNRYFSLQRAGVVPAEKRQRK